MTERLDLQRLMEKIPKVEVVFEQEIIAAAEHGDSMLDAGCSDGSFGILSRLKSQGVRLVGLDLDIENLAENPWLDKHVEGNVENMPFEDNSFDMIMCRSVFEHLENPGAALSEFARTLRPHGRVFISTFNLYHPQNFISALLPLNLRRLLKSKLIKPDAVEGTYPTYYRCNTRRAFAKLTKEARLSETGFMSCGTRPDYWSNQLMAAFFLFYEKVTDIKVLQGFKPHILASYTKD